MRASARFYSTNPSSGSEVLFVDHMADPLTPTGRAGIIVPEGIIFLSQTPYKQLRRVLVEEYLVAVVSLPAGVFNPYSGVKTSIQTRLESRSHRRHANLLERASASPGESAKG